jgi:fumarylacetoacetase
VGVAIGNQIVDLAALDDAGLMPTAAKGAFAASSLNRFIALGKPVWTDVRARLTALLSADDQRLSGNAALRDKALVPMSAATLHLPVDIPGYTDFYSSREHATNVGRMFRDPENALLPNWLEIPIGYNGREFGGRQRHCAASSQWPDQAAERGAPDLQSLPQARLRA